MTGIVTFLVILFLRVLGLFSLEKSGRCGKNGLMIYMINEIIDESNVVGLYQKQDISYEGLSAYMLVSDCRYLYEQGYLIYNIMADIGSEGLRRSKTMLDPLVMLKKYNIIVK